MSTLSTFAQSVHHQMTSAQGAIVHTSSGVVLKQSVGQQSVIGKYSGSQFSVGQGFIQGGFSQKTITHTPSIQVTCYPNPFVSKVNLQFSAPIDGAVQVYLYDATGRLLYTAEKSMLNNLISIDAPTFLTDGAYILKLQAKNFNYTTNLLKSK
ncbi:MAG: hypothetical protein RL207_1354 [Bacteroidota bacterium]|jgi:hypothetical protein